VARIDEVAMWAIDSKIKTNYQPTIFDFVKKYLSVNVLSASLIECSKLLMELDPDAL